MQQQQQPVFQQQRYLQGKTIAFGGRQPNAQAGVRTRAAIYRNAFYILKRNAGFMQQASHQASQGSSMIPVRAAVFLRYYLSVFC